MKHFVILFLLPQITFSQSFFETVNHFLLTNVEDGKVDYSQLKSNQEELDQLVLSISEFYLNDQNIDFQSAFYINAYNILVIKNVVNHYPMKSPKEIDGFFDRQKFIVAGESLTLDQIEFEKLFEATKDPRIHFALGCAAKSCPFLYDQAYTPDHLQQQLTFRAQLIIDRPNYVEIDKRKRIVRLNKIFDWYSKQFKEENASLLDYINTYRFYNVPTDYDIEFMEYDWSLNGK